jgi:thioredoxin 2
MTGNVLLRCGNCGAVNRVPADKLNSNPKCGKCKNYLTFPKAPVNVTAGNFDREVLGWPGAVLVEFWAPW